jgi:hypothetical protein
VRVADIDDFDFDRSAARAWAEFQARLAEVISMIDESADLTIGTAAVNPDGVPFVRFRCLAPHLIRAEAASNATLNTDFQLTPDQLTAMEELGWRPPGAEPEAGADFWVQRPQDDADQLAAVAVAALRDVYGVQHPVFLAPDQLAEVLQAPPAEEPVLVSDADDVTAVVPSGRSHLDTLVEAELTAIFGHAPLRDTDGDVAIRVGSAMLFLRTAPDAQEVVLFAPVVHDVAGRSRATEVLNDLNVEARWVKFQLVRDRVFVVTSVPAWPFVPAHLQQAVRIMAETADSVDDELARKLNGRTTFDGQAGLSDF